MQLNKEQVEAINFREGAANVLATAGSGKTTVLVERVRRLLHEGATLDDLLAVTFTNEAAKNLEKRLGIKTDKAGRGGFRTFHSFCLNLVRREAKFLPYGLSSEPFPDGPVLSKLLLGAMKENGIKRKQFDEVKAFISRWKRQRILPREVEQHDETTDNAFVLAYEKYEQRLRDGGMLDFDSMVVEAVNILEQSPEVRDRWQFKWVMCDEAQDTDNLQFLLLQLVSKKHNNVFVVGDFCQCQPPGTQVKVLDKYRNGRTASQCSWQSIENLRSGQQVIGWSKEDQRTYQIGRTIKTAARHYNGVLISVSCGSNTTKVTPNHWFYARYNEAAKGKYLVYLMYKAPLGFRVGISKVKRIGTGKVMNSYGLSYRMNQEDADKAWILRICLSRAEAEAWEEIYSIKYQIPESVFKAGNCIVKTDEFIKLVFSHADPAGARRCLEDHGLFEDLPLRQKDRETTKYDKSWRGYFKISACNLVPDIMDLPLEGINKSAPITDIARADYSGPVYSLEVEKDGTYLSDGVVVGNSLYSFRGAHPENLINFSEWFPGAKTIILPENYRSTQSVVRFSKENAPLRNELTDNIRTANPEGAPIEFRMFAGPTEEAESTLAAASSDPGNSAVLARTNQQLGIFETLALQHGIKFHLLGRSGLWNKPEIKSLVGLATFCVNGKQPERYAETLVGPYRARIRTLPADAALNEIIRVSNLESLYSNEDYAEDENFAVSNIQAVADIAKRFRSLSEFLNHARKAAHASRKSKNALTLSTVHQAKGLEWQNVFVVGVQVKKMPHERGDLEEERRIFYVAISRAATRLRISFAGSPSVFVERYLTPEIRRELQKHASQVERIQKQQELFV